MKALLEYPPKPRAKRWILWAHSCEQIIIAYFPEAEVSIQSSTGDCPKWTFTTETKYQDALLCVLCSILKHLHLLRFGDIDQ